MSPIFYGELNRFSKYLGLAEVLTLSSERDVTVMLASLTSHSNMQRNHGIDE